MSDDGAVLVLMTYLFVSLEEGAQEMWRAMSQSLALMWSCSVSPSPPRVPSCLPRVAYGRASRRIV